MPGTTSAAGLRIRGLTKSYGPVRAVAGVDLDIAAGETVALLGPDGAGKSTTIDMLLGLTRPDAGSVAVFGRTPEQAGRRTTALSGGQAQRVRFALAGTWTTRNRAEAIRAADDNGWL